MDIGNDVDVERDHVAHHGADFVIAFAFRAARFDSFGVDLGVDDLDVQTFLGKKPRLQRIHRRLHMASMPAAVADSQFHNLSDSLLLNFRFNEVRIEHAIMDLAQRLHPPKSLLRILLFRPEKLPSLRTSRR